MKRIRQENIIPISKKAMGMIDQFVEDYKKGDIKDAIIILNRENGEPEYMPLTNSDYSTLGWLLFQAMQGLFYEQMMGEENDGDE